LVSPVSHAVASCDGCAQSATDGRPLSAVQMIVGMAYWMRGGSAAISAQVRLRKAAAVPESAADGSV
jgi:hypothetical protein